MGISWAAHTLTLNEGCRDSIGGLSFVAGCGVVSAGCWPLAADCCWLMAAGNLAVLESVLNKGCMNSLRNIWAWFGGSGLVWSDPWGQLVVPEGFLGVPGGLGGPREVHGSPWRRPWTPWGVPGVIGRFLRSSL